MKVLLRKSGQALYFTASGEWMPSRAKALDLDTVELACAYARERKWDGVEVVLSHDDPLRDLVLPLKRHIGVDGAEQNWRSL
jgi:hypothetical protein